MKKEEESDKDSVWVKVEKSNEEDEPKKDEFDKEDSVQVRVEGKLDERFADAEE